MTVPGVLKFFTELALFRTRTEGANGVTKQPMYHGRELWIRVQLCLPKIQFSAKGPEGIDSKKMPLVPINTRDGKN
jgi:hypothetical protein